jgi:CRP/FNR family transcriptional regulator, cyclic AMP receptor protein
MQPALFRKLSLFAELDDRELASIAGVAKTRRYAKDDVIFHADESGDVFCVIREGKVKITMISPEGKEIILSMMGPGDFFGEMALLDSRPRSANVVALEDTTVVALSRDAFRAHLTAHPHTAVNILGELAHRLRRADETIAQLALHDVESRLSRTLLRLAHEDGETVDSGLLLKKRPTQQDLANMVGSCRETISRTFTSMIKRGLLLPRGRALVLTRQLIDRVTPMQPAAAL